MHKGIKLLFPDIQEHEFEVWDNADGSGPYIGRWSRESTPPTTAQILAALQAAQDDRPEVMADFKSRREVYLNRLTGIAGRAMRDGDATLAVAADDFSDGLLDLPAHPAVVAAPDADALKAAIMARYRELVIAAVTAAPNGKPAFDKVSK